MISFPDALAVVEAAAKADPAMMAMVMARLGGTLASDAVEKAKARPCPTDRPTALQVTVFDNHPDGVARKGKRDRYVVEMKAWAGPASGVKIERPQFKATARLIAASAIEAEITRLQNPTKVRQTMSPAYAEALRFVAAENPDAMVGLMASKPYGEGTVYHDCQFVVCRIADGKVTECSLFLSPEVMIDVRHFADHDAAKKPLRGFAHSQSRAATHSRFIGWRTSNLYYYLSEELERTDSY